MHIDDIDQRLIELYRNDSIIHTGIDMALSNGLSEVEMLTMLVMTLANANKAMMTVVLKHVRNASPPVHIVVPPDHIVIKGE